MKEKIVVSCFDWSTVFVQPWAKNGYKCYCVDIQHTRGETEIAENIIAVGINISEWVPPSGNIVFAAFFPPCTDLSVSGARWFKDKGLFALSDAIRLFAHSVRFAEWIGAPYFIENPVSTISSYWRKSDFRFDPCDFGGYLDPPGDKYTKETHLWVGNGFKMPRYKPVFASDVGKIHKMPPSEERANLRSMTPEGFSKAIYEYNKDQ